MGLSSDRAYAIEDVQRLANGPSRAVGVHPTVLTSAPMRISLGPGAVGMEVSAIRRNNAGPGRGIYTGWNLGGGGTPNRTVNQAASPRSVVWGGASAGYQADHQRLRYRIGWGFTGVFLPSSWPNGRPETVLNVGNHPEEAGWLVFASGPSTSLGWVLTESLTLVARPKAHFAVLNVNGEGLQAVPWLRLGIGPELSW